tara:strand:+ start:190 stop:885 length:696 start_codon:yes stop_codon:yes gene_type:complete
MVDTIEPQDNTVIEEQQKQNLNTDRPSWLPEKFNTAEDLAKAYGELEKAYSSKEAPQPMTQQQVEQTTGLSLDNYYTEFAEKGELSEDSYNQLASQGLSRDLVDSYIEGQSAIADNHVSQIKGIAGSDAEYDKIVNWASTNLPEQEVITYNNVIENGTVEEAMMAVSGLKARFDNQVGVTPTLLKGNVATEGSAFQSTAEIVAAINDPRYSVDTAYRKSVEDKIKRSNALG